MTGQRHSRQATPNRILEWCLVGLAALWFAVVPIVAAVLLALTPTSLEGPWTQAAVILILGGVHTGGLMLAAAAGRLIPGWDRLTLVSLTLALAAGWSMLARLIQTTLPYPHTAYETRPPWSALLLLLAGVPYMLGLGGRVAAWARGRSWPPAWADLGLTRSGSVHWALAAAAVGLWPWLLVGSLGDAYQSAVIGIQSLAQGLLTEWLWRGLVLNLLLITVRRRWAAGLLGGLLYLGSEVGTALQTGGGEAMWSAAMALSLAFLVTELWARPGDGRHGVWGAVTFHVLFRAFPRLFADPRSELELGHLAARTYMLLATGGAAILLFLVRKLFRYRAAGRSRFGSAATAAIPWALATGVYLVFGAPGFANNGYLIILQEQADLSPASAIADREERLVHVHSLLVETAEDGQSALREELERMGVAYRPYYLVNMIRVDGTTRGMKAIARRPDVSQVILNPNMRQYPLRWRLPYGSPSDQSNDLPWGVASTNADKVWEMGFTGQGIVVAGQDTGFEWDHPALKDHYRGWDRQTVDHDRNWHDAWDDEPAAFDDDNHGTHTMGTAVGQRVGIAPGAQWIGCRNMRFGLGNPGAYVECMEFFLAPYPVGGDPFRDGDPRLAPHVVNNSWGCPPEEGCVGPEPIHTAVDVLRAAGIMMVVSAGNEGPGCSSVLVPANEDSVFSVGAIDEKDEILPFSSRGPATGGLSKPDVVAPGINVYSSVPGGGFAGAGGTSMAGPHVAGLAALLWSANPDLLGDIDLTERIIVETARPRPTTVECPAQLYPCSCGLDRPGQVPNNIYGHGIVDALAAVRAALQL